MAHDFTRCVARFAKGVGLAFLVLLPFLLGSAFGPILRVPVLFTSYVILALLSCVYGQLIRKDWVTGWRLANLIAVMMLGFVIYCKSGNPDRWFQDRAQIEAGIERRFEALHDSSLWSRRPSPEYEAAVRRDYARLQAEYRYRRSLSKLSRGGRAPLVLSILGVLAFASLALLPEVAIMRLIAAKRGTSP